MIGPESLVWGTCRGVADVPKVTDDGRAVADGESEDWVGSSLFFPGSPCNFCAWCGGQTRCYSVDIYHLLLCDLVC